MTEYFEILDYDPEDQHITIVGPWIDLVLTCGTGVAADDVVKARKIVRILNTHWKTAKPAKPKTSRR